MIKAEIVADSLSPQGDRLTSILCTFPRIILAEVNTHRMLSKNTSSSRAIPFNKMVEAVTNNPFVPIAWQKHHSGMQGNEYITDEHILKLKKGMWLNARNKAVQSAEELYGNVSRARSMFDVQELPNTGVTKQLCNRLLEPFMWTTMLITGSKEGWDNFFELRCPAYEDKMTGEIVKSRKEISPLNEYGEYPKYFDNTLEWLQINKGQAEIHIMDLAEKIYDVMNESVPKRLESGEWHIPFGDNIQLTYTDYDSKGIITNEGVIKKVKIATAMAARTSYTVVGDEKEVDYQKMINLHDRLIEMRHDSPLEHCARAMSDEEYYTFVKGQVGKQGYINQTKTGYNGFEPKESKMFGWCRNFKGFIQYRHFIEEDTKS